MSEKAKQVALQTAEISAKTALSMIPVGGALITSVWDSIKSNCAQKRLDEWQNVIEERLSKVDESLENIGVPTRVQTGIEMNKVAEPYIRRRAVRHLEKGRVVIFGAGTGNPYFSTDTAAALRAAEMEADVILLAKNVDAVYDKDPKEHADAKKFTKLSYMEVINRELKVMDSTATSLCMDNKITIKVFELNTENIIKVVYGEDVGTTVE